MKNFEHYEEQIKRFEEKDNTSSMNCNLWEMRVGEISSCDGRCCKCFLETFNWLNEEYQEPKVVLPKKLAIVLTGLCKVEAFEILYSLCEDVYTLRLYAKNNHFGYLSYNRINFDIKSLQLEKKYYLKDCDFTKGEE